MTTFILILTLLCFIRKCRQLACDLTKAYAAIATLQDDAMYERTLARVRAQPVEPPHYETPFDAQLPAPVGRDWAAEAQMALERR